MERQLEKIIDLLERIYSKLEWIEKPYKRDWLRSWRHERDYNPTKRHSKKNVIMGRQALFLYPKARW